jgi:hypothetical protein
VSAHRIQLRRTKGWRKPEGAIVVARPSKWGNPFRVGEMAQHWHRSAAWPNEMYLDTHIVVRAEQAVGLYRKVIVDPVEHRYEGFSAPTMVAIRADLAGHDLACWCPLDQPCHADVLLELANGESHG